jgi:hypothetical protein
MFFFSMKLLITLLVHVNKSRTSAISVSLMFGVFCKGNLVAWVYLTQTHTHILHARTHTHTTLHTHTHNTHAHSPSLTHSVKYINYISINHSFCFIVCDAGFQRYMYMFCFYEKKLISCLFIKAFSCFMLINIFFLTHSCISRCFPCDLFYMKRKKEKLMHFETFFLTVYS